MPRLHVDNFGTKHWYLDKNLHRVNGPAVEYVDGAQEWWLYGKLHRTDGPAVEHADGSKFWYYNDFCHRLNGPAIEWCNGTISWYLNGIRYHSINDFCKAAAISGAKKTLFLLKWDNTDVR